MVTDIENADLQNNQSDIESPSPAFESMPHEARHALIYLMRHGAILAAQNNKIFDLICNYQDNIRRHLAEVYLSLILDEKSGVAFIASFDYQNGGITDADSKLDAEDLDPEDVKTLIPKRILTVYDTLLLLVLRKYYQDRESAGEQKIIIDLERLESLLTPFMPLTDHSSKDRKKLASRTKEMVKRKILANVRGSDDRYEITPIIRYIVNADFLETLLKQYTELISDNAEQLG